MIGTMCLPKSLKYLLPDPLQKINEFKIFAFLTILESNRGTSLVVQWQRIHLTTQGTRVRSLVRELRSHMPRGN